MRRHRAARPEGPKFEARSPMPRRGGVLGQGAASSLPSSCRVRESGVSFPREVRAAEIDFWVFLIPQKASSATILGSKSILRQKFWEGKAHSVACFQALIMRRHEPSCLIGSTAYDRTISLVITPWSPSITSVNGWKVLFESTTPREREILRSVLDSP